MYKKFITDTLTLPKQYKEAVMLLSWNTQSLTARLGSRQFDAPSNQQKCLGETIDVSTACFVCFFIWRKFITSFLTEAAS